MIVPVLGRPQNAQPLVESFRASGADGFIIFALSDGDHEQAAACVATMRDGLYDVNLFFMHERAGPGDYARKINAAYAFRGKGDDWLERTELVLLGADDLRFQPGWLEAVERIADEYDVGVIGTNDNANPSVKAGRHSTHPVVRRCYIDRYGGSVGEPGQVYHQGYDHNWVDCELVETAKARGCYAHAHDALVTHHHPLYDHRVKRDATYAKGNAREREDAALFRSRQHLWEQEVRV